MAEGLNLPIGEIVSRGSARASNRTSWTKVSRAEDLPQGAGFTPASEEYRKREEPLNSSAVRQETPAPFSRVSAKGGGRTHMSLTYNPVRSIACGESTIFQGVC